MTDVLEQLLKEPEEEENEWEEVWRPVGTGALYREGAAAGDASVRQETGLPEAEKTEGGRQAELSAEPAFDRAEAADLRQDAARSVAERMARLHRAAQRRGGTTARPGAGGSESGRDVGLIRGAAGEKRDAADYAALVDAAFARDARRYDGSLRLL